MCYISLSDCSLWHYDYIGDYIIVKPFFHSTTVSLQRLQVFVTKFDCQNAAGATTTREMQRRALPLSMLALPPIKTLNFSIILHHKLLFKQQTCKPCPRERSCENWAHFFNIECFKLTFEIGWQHSLALPSRQALPPVRRGHGYCRVTMIYLILVTQY